MKRCIAALGIGSILLLGSLAQAAYVDVAMNKPVSVAGSVSGAALSTLTDGAFRPRSTQWQDGTVWWNGLAPALIVDLGAQYTLSAAIVQADDNDTYRLDYLDGQGQWQAWWNIPAPGGWGMQTRPNPTSDGIWQPLATITTTQVRFQATGGDNSYSVSEIQVAGAAAVPLPAAAWGGLGLLSVVGAMKIRRRIA